MSGTLFSIRIFWDILLAPVINLLASAIFLSVRLYACAGKRRLQVITGLTAVTDIDLYMEMSEGFKKEGHIIRIRKGLYGLKQAAALWYDDVKAFLAKQGMFPTTTDVCLYTNEKETYL